jgi:hypothetical protein
MACQSSIVNNVHFKEKQKQVAEWKIISLTVSPSSECMSSPKTVVCHLNQL